MRISVFTSLLTCSSVLAFSPSSTTPVISSSRNSSSQLNAENVGRREAMMGAVGAALGTALLFPQSSNAITNPALQTFKARKQGKGQFIPGKGLHNNIEYDNLVAANNPALQTLKARKPTKGQFIPGKGLHAHEEDEHLMAITNPALQTFKARKQGKGQFIPGKGLHSSNTFEELFG